MRRASWPAIWTKSITLAARASRDDLVPLVVHRRALVEKRGVELPAGVLHRRRPSPSTGTRFTCTFAGDMKMLTR